MLRCSWSWAARLCSALHRQGVTSPAPHCSSSRSPSRDSPLINFHSLYFHLFSIRRWPLCKGLNKALQTLEAIALIVSVHHCINLSQWMVVLCLYVCFFARGRDPTHLALLWMLKLFSGEINEKTAHCISCYYSVLFNARAGQKTTVLDAASWTLSSFQTMPFPMWFVETFLGAGPEDRLSWFSPKPLADRIIFPPVLSYRLMVS